MSAPPPLMLPDPSGNYYPPDTSEPNESLPINLDSLRDGPPGTKPFYPYSTLIRYAIKGSPNQKLLLEDIYYAIESRFPYFRTAPNGWKNSVRHNLSLNPCFQKEPRPLTDRGKGSYWIVNDEVDPRTGVHRIRKKKPKSGKSRGIAEDQDVDYGEGGFEDGQYPSPHLDENGQPRPAVYPPFPGFNPIMVDMRFSLPIPITAEDNFEVDENGEVNWRLAWIKEIGHLQHITSEQEKAGADQDWYRMMLFRIRAALMPPPPINPEMLPHMAGEDGQQTVVPEQT
ncbi:hypothetical protein C8F01DRAFT_1116575 [Mycena amicta]|nr:hypothetical protein C8F01DRAFT_1116575 [Mycena amicta]